MWSFKWLPLLLFGLLLGCGQKSPPSESEKFRDAILRVLQKDKELGQSLKQLNAEATPSQIAAGLDRNCLAMEHLDLSNCPPEFRLAYRHHVRAWRDAEKALRNVPDSFWQGVVVGLTNGLRGEADGGGGRITKELNAAEFNVNSTYEAVEKIAANYGAVL